MWLLANRFVNTWGVNSGFTDPPREPQPYFISNSLPVPLLIIWIRGFKAEAAGLVRKLWPCGSLGPRSPFPGQEGDRSEVKSVVWGRWTHRSHVTSHFNKRRVPTRTSGSVEEEAASFHPLWVNTSLNKQYVWMLFITFILSKASEGETASEWKCSSFCSYLICSGLVLMV